MDWDYEALGKDGRSLAIRNVLEHELREHGFELHEVPGTRTGIIARRRELALEIWPRIAWRDNPLWATEKFLPASGRWACAALLRDGSPPRLYLVPSMRWMDADEVFSVRQNVGTGPEWTIRLRREHLKAEMVAYELERVLSRITPRLVDQDRVSAAIQRRLEQQERDEVSVVEAAQWLADDSVLRDSPTRPGLPLLELLRAGLVPGAEQRPAQPNGRWFVRRLTTTRRQTVGRPYVSVDERAMLAVADPFPVDPGDRERGTRSHARLQNLLADWVRSRGWEPRSPVGEPLYDLVWLVRDVCWVAEVKSVTDENEERQMRLALGQVLRYRQRLGSLGRAVRAVLMIEREPRDKEWLTLCHELNVRLLWPELLTPPSSNPLSGES